MTDGQNQRLGAYVETSAAGERVRAYVPAPLPPKPALELGRWKTACKTFQIPGVNSVQ